MRKNLAIIYVYVYIYIYIYIYITRKQLALDLNFTVLQFINNSSVSFVGISWYCTLEIDFDLGSCLGHHYSRFCFRLGLICVTHLCSSFSDGHLAL